MKQQYRDYMMEQLEKLLSIDSPSGYTKEVQQYMNDELKKPRAASGPIWGAKATPSA